MKVAVFGGIYIDIISQVASIPSPGHTVIAEQVEVSLGGKASNTAVAMARQGVSIIMVGEVGTDPLGQKALDAFKLEHIDTKLVAQRP